MHPSVGGRGCFCFLCVLAPEIELDTSVLHQRFLHYGKLLVGFPYLLSTIERPCGPMDLLTTDQGIPGSSPGRVDIWYFTSMCNGARESVFNSSVL